MTGRRSLEDGMRNERRKTKKRSLATRQMASNTNARETLRTISGRVAGLHQLLRRLLVLPQELFRKLEQSLTVAGKSKIKSDAVRTTYIRLLLILQLQGGNLTRFKQLLMKLIDVTFFHGKPHLRLSERA